MKIKTFLFSVIVLFLLNTSTGCEKETLISDIYHTWKLEGFGNSTNSSFRAAEPQSCTECFIITFYTDSTFSGKSTINLLAKNFTLSGNSLSFPNGVLTTLVDEVTGDGTKYTDALKNVNRFFIENSKLKLFYSDSDYLLYHLISQ